MKVAKLTQRYVITYNIVQFQLLNRLHLVIELAMKIMHKPCPENFVY